MKVKAANGFARILKAWKVSDHSSACMSAMARAVGFHGGMSPRPRR